MLKRPLRTLMEDYAPLMPLSTSLVIQMYQAHPNPPLLDFAKQVKHSISVCIFAEYNICQSHQIFSYSLVHSLEVHILFSAADTVY